MSWKFHFQGTLGEQVRLVFKSVGFSRIGSGFGRANNRVRRFLALRFRDATAMIQRRKKGKTWRQRA